jgi:hypothetical protein
MLRVGHPAGRVSEEQRAEYARDGAVCIRGAFSPDWIERLRACADLAYTPPSAPQLPPAA